MSRTQSVSLSLLILTVDSQLQTGFELDAFLLHGYIPQLFAMLVMPLTGSCVQGDQTIVARNPLRNTLSWMNSVIFH